MVLSFKSYLKNIYTRHYFKMIKILTGAKLLLMSIYYLHFVLKHFKVSGLSKWFASKLALMDDLEPWVLNLVLCLITSGLTEFISNPAVNNLMMPILSSLVRASDVLITLHQSLIYTEDLQKRICFAYLYM